MLEARGPFMTTLPTATAGIDTRERHIAWPQVPIRCLVAACLQYFQQRTRLLSSRHGSKNVAAVTDRPFGPALRRAAFPLALSIPVLRNPMYGLPSRLPLD